MVQSEDGTDNKDKKTDIEYDFENKHSGEFYRYYCWKQSGLINSWDQLLDCYYKELSEQKISRWLFRGDIGVCDKKRSMREAFKTSLDKAFEDFDVKPQNLSRIETAIIRAFRRRAHLLTDDKNNTQNQLEALALLRHYGAPGRILDWTYSFFASVYFAMNREYNKKEEKTKYTIWALNRKWLHCENVLFENEIFLKDNAYLDEHSLKKDHLKYYQEYDNSLFQKFVVTYIINRNPKSIVYAANPYRLNERLVAQRGTLLFPGTVDRTWGENLRNMMNKSLNHWQDQNDAEKMGGPVLWEIPFELSQKERGDFLRRLDEMNINHATLFPDLDGFAQSLRTRIANPESLGVFDE